MSASETATTTPAVQSLIERVFDHLVDANCSNATADLVLAALEGESALAAVLEGGPAPDRPESARERTAPAGAFLTGLEVEGFRGIGQRTQLTLTPGPGLTVISGRNGSGKSSLAEALECALTGTTARWERRVSNSDFRAAWRNLHHPDVCRIAVSFNEVGQGAATIAMTWPRGPRIPQQAPSPTRSATANGSRPVMRWVGGPPCRLTGRSCRTTIWVSS